MSLDDPSFVAWEEHIVCHERGSRVVHFCLKEGENSVLAVVGTERSIRHMIYVVADEFVKAYGSKGFINPSTKWRARREVVEWLASMVSKNHPDSQMNDLAQGLGSLEVSERMIPRKLKAQNSDIAWSGVAWICAKQLKHYPAFCRNKTTIAVHSFVFIMAEGESNYLGYLEDMYEDKKGLKKVKVRWFHHNQEVKGVISQLNPHPREVFITPHVQVISAECIDGLATVLTPKHYEKCVAVVPDSSPSPILMCFRQFKNNRIKPFTLTKLRGYHSQAIFSSFDGLLDSKQKVKRHKLDEEDEEELTHDDPVRLGTKRKRSCKGQQGVESAIGVRESAPGSQTTKGEPTYPKLKLRLSKKTMGIKFVEPQSQNPVSIKVDEKIELLCQDSGIQGCWFRCRVLQACLKRLKVQYDDVRDAEESGNLEEWVPACRVAAPDKLGMRCRGRLTIRPPPSEDISDCMFEVGAAVDAWWCDGWWEGVVTRVDSSGNVLQVYLPGESKFLTVDRKDVRTSRDWFGNRWVDIKAKPDILSHASANASPSPSTKLPISPATVEASGGGSSASLEHKGHTILKLEAVEEQELPASAVSNQISSGDLPPVNDENKIKGGSNDRGGKCYDDEVEDNDDDNDDGDDNETGGGSKGEVAMEEDLESANQKC